MRLLLILVLLSLSSPAIAGHLHREAWYQARWCAEVGGQTEVVMPNGTRCDCLTESHAIEFDFAPKWAEAIGQALHYAAHTGKTPGVVLILEDPVKEQKYLNRLSFTNDARSLGITVWTTTP